MAVKLTDDQLAELQESFSIFDKNGDGKITPGELVQLTKSMNRQVSESKVQNMIDRMDCDGDGKVDFNEFCNHCKGTVKTEKDLVKAFKEFDSDGNGFITETELHAAMHRLGQSLDTTQVKQMIDSADRDGDGRVNYKEFLRLMTKK